MSRCSARSGAPATRQTSALVPPMSRPKAGPRPRRSTRAATATTPPAGPAQHRLGAPPPLGVDAGAHPGQTAVRAHIVAGCPRQQGAGGGVHQAGDQAVQEAPGGRDPVAHRDPAKAGLAAAPRQALLLGGGQGSVHQHDGHGVDALRAGGAQARGVYAGGSQHLPLGADAPLHLDHRGAGRAGPAGAQVEEAQPALIPQPGQITQPRGGEQQHRSARALQQGVGRHGGAAAHRQAGPWVCLHQNGVAGHFFEADAPGCIPAEDIGEGAPLVHPEGGAGHRAIASTWPSQGSERVSSGLLSRTV